MSEPGFPEPSRRRRWSWLFVPLSVVTFYAGAVAAERLTILLGYDPGRDDLPGWVVWAATVVLLAVTLLAPAAGVVLARRAIRIDGDGGARRPLLVNAGVAVAFVAVFVLLAI